MLYTPWAPVRRFDVDGLFGLGIDPTKFLSAHRKHERDNIAFTQHANLKVDIGGRD